MELLAEYESDADHCVKTRKPLIAIDPAPPIPGDGDSPFSTNSPSPPPNELDISVAGGTTLALPSEHALHSMHLPARPHIYGEAEHVPHVADSVFEVGFTHHRQREISHRRSAAASSASSASLSSSSLGAKRPRDAARASASAQGSSRQPCHVQLLVRKEEMLQDYQGRSIFDHVPLPSARRADRRSKGGCTPSHVISSIRVSAGVNCMAMHPTRPIQQTARAATATATADGEWEEQCILACGLMDGSLLIYLLPSCMLLMKLVGHAAGIRFVSFLPDCSNSCGSDGAFPSAALLVSSSYDGRLVVWNLEQQSVLVDWNFARQRSQEHATCVLATRSSRSGDGGQNRLTMLLGMAKSNEIRQIDLPLSLSLPMSEKVGREDDEEEEAAEDGAVRYVYKGHVGAVQSLAWIRPVPAATGHESQQDRYRYFMSSSSDKSLRIWEAGYTVAPVKIVSEPWLHAVPHLISTDSDGAETGTEQGMILVGQSLGDELVCMTVKEAESGRLILSTLSRRHHHPQPHHRRLGHRDGNPSELSFSGHACCPCFYFSAVQAVGNGPMPSVVAMVGDATGSLFVFHPRSGRILRRIPRAHAKAISAVASCTPDAALPASYRFVATGSWDKTIKVWSVS